MPLHAETAWTFRQELPVAAGSESLPFIVEDAAGNVTRGEIELAPAARRTPKTRQGHAVPVGLPRLALLDRDAVVSDLDAWHTTPLRVAQDQDRDPPRITFTGPEDREIVYDNTIYLEGKVTDASPITAFTIAGESYWRHKCYQLFFGYVALLRAGQTNGFLLEAADEWGNRGERAIRVRHQVQPMRQLGARLRVLLLPFAKTGQPSVLTETVFASLFDALVAPQRFYVIDYTPTVPHEALAAPATAAQVGKALAAEGILLGTVLEAEQRHSLDVYVRFVDVETETVLAAEDVYGEELTPHDVKTLMAGLVLKLQRHFPLDEGVVVAREGRQIWVTLSGKPHLQAGMKLLVFRDGKSLEHSGKKLQTPASVLGEARITALSADLLEARLLPSTAPEEVRESDKVMPK
jgi:TolB-like protein